MNGSKSSAGDTRFPWRAEDRRLILVWGGEGTQRGSDVKKACLTLLLLHSHRLEVPSILPLPLRPAFSFLSTLWKIEVRCWQSDG